MRLPTADEGAAGLLRLAEEYGAEAVYQLIRMLRTKGRDGEDIGAQAMHKLAVLLVEAEMHDSNVTYETARSNVALKLGYSRASEGNSSSNFYRVLRGDARPADARPSSKYRDGEKGT